MRSRNAKASKGKAPLRTKRPAKTSNSKLQAVNTKRTSRNKNSMQNSATQLTDSTVHAQEFDGGHVFRDAIKNEIRASEQRLMKFVHEQIRNILARERKVEHESLNEEEALRSENDLADESLDDGEALQQMATVPTTFDAPLDIKNPRATTQRDTIPDSPVTNPHNPALISHTTTFLKLPREHRQTIYRLHLTSLSPIDLSPFPPYIREPALLATNKDIRAEALPVYYGTNTFSSRFHVGMRTWLNESLDAERLGMLRDVRVSTSVPVEFARAALGELLVRSAEGLRVDAVRVCVAVSVEGNEEEKGKGEGEVKKSKKAKGAEESEKSAGGKGNRNEGGRAKKDDVEKKGAKKKRRETNLKTEKRWMTMASVEDPDEDGGGK